MHVLYVSRSRGVHDRRFVEAWERGGAVVTVLAVDDVEPEGSPPGPRFTSALRSAIGEVHPDVVQVGPLTWPGAIVAGEWEGPLIAASWGFDLMRDIDVDAATAAEARATVERADLLLVDNDGPARRARELGAHPGAIVSFPWGIDVAGFTPSGGAERDPYRVVSIRRHEPLYRVADVLDALALAHQTEPRLRLVVGGSGSGTAELRARADEIGIGGLVDWPGDLPPRELAGLLGSAALYVSTSPVDGSSVSLLEAMASRTPVAVTDIEGNRQWVNERTGWRFPAGDVGALADLMVNLTGSAETGSRTAAAAELVVAGADWAATAARFPEFAELAIAAADRRRRGEGAAQ